MRAEAASEGESSQSDSVTPLTLEALNKSAACGAVAALVLSTYGIIKHTQNVNGNELVLYRSVVQRLSSLLE